MKEGEVDRAMCYIGGVEKCSMHRKLEG